MLRKMSLRQLRQEGLLLLAIAGIMVIGTTVFVALQSSHQNLKRAQREYYQRTQLADFWIRVKKAPNSTLEEIRGLPGVRDVEARIKHFATADITGAVRPLNCLVLSLPDRPRPHLNDIVIRQGGYFSELRANEVIVIDQFARAHDIRTGQWIELNLNQRKQQLLVVGTAISSEFTYLLGPGTVVPDPGQFGVFFVKRSFAEDVFDFNGAANEFVGRWSSSNPALQKIWLAQIESRLSGAGVLSTTPRDRQTSHQFLDGEIKGLGAVATVLPTIFLVAAALILNVLMTRIARKQRQVVGTLKALGYSDSQVFWHFLTLALVVGVFAGLAGSLLGYAASCGMAVLYRSFFEFPELNAGVYFYAYAIVISLSLICAIAGSARGARSLYRLAPAEAMRPEPPRSGGAIYIERIRLIWDRLSTAWRLAIRGVIRQRFRTVAAVFSTTMGAGLLAAGFLNVNTVFFLVDFQFRQLSRSDIELFTDGERDLAVVDEVRRMPGIDYVEPVYYLPCTMTSGPYHYKTSITGLQPDARLTRPKMADGTPIPVPQNGVIINRRLADILHVKIHDVVMVQPTRGDRTTRVTRVAQISDSFLGVNAYGDIEHTSRLAGEELVVNSVQALTDHLPEHDQARNQKLKQLPAINMILSRHDLIASLKRTVLRNMMVFIVMLIGFSGMVFFGSLLNTSLINYNERVREVATLRALGYSPWHVGGLFLRETAMLAAIGTALGLPLGYGLMWLATLPYRTNDVIRIPLASAPWLWWLTILLAAVFLLTAHAFVQVRIHRLNFREVLNVRE
ncbi:MAG: ABC transporter permease [Planctomycetota bacterium]|nr:ABC transporter permease [Planctomycetota bacterium]